MSEAGSGRYPFDPEGPLCDLLNDGDFLFDAYVESGFRQEIKAFCKRHRWPGKPAVAVAVGEEQLKSLLMSLFGTVDGRKRFAEVAAENKRKGRDSAPLLYQAIWTWLQEVNSDLADRVKSHCHERREGLLFLSTEALTELASALATEGADEATTTQLARTVLAFVMLQPDDGEALADAFIAVFPQYVQPMRGQ